MMQWALAVFGFVSLGFLVMLIHAHDVIKRQAREIKELRSQVLDGLERLRRSH